MESSSPSRDSAAAARPAPASRPRVVILGGGFGGVGAARKLKQAEVDVVLVDKHNYHTFQPLLYQVATDLLETSTVGHPLRDLFQDQPNTTVHAATVTGIDLARRQVQLAEMAPLAYDYLVLALGAQVSFFGVEGASEHAFPLYTLPDAVRLKEHVLSKWEAADKDPTLADDGALDVVVVGGGPTGVETAGALAELYHNTFAGAYRSLAQTKPTITLVEASPQLFTMFKPNLRTYTKQALEKRGVEVLLGEAVAAVTPTRVTLKSGRTLRAHTLVWGAGLRAHPLARSLGVAVEKGDRVATRPDLSLAEYPEVFVVGDVSWTIDPKTNAVLPQLGSVAMQAGERAGENIARLVDGKPTEPFAYFDKGMMATIGRGAGVVQLPRGRTMKGKAAWLAWGAVHLALLSTGEDRAKTMVDWTWAGFTHERSARATVTADEP
jgi:NADH dehydrogenase